MQILIMFLSMVFNQLSDNKSSTIENKKNNYPRIQIKSKEEFAEIMNSLNLTNSKMMDVAVPANVKSLTLDQI